jgi:hypothetical protein
MRAYRGEGHDGLEVLLDAVEVGEAHHGHDHFAGTSSQVGGHEHVPLREHHVDHLGVGLLHHLHKLPDQLPVLQLLHHFLQGEDM